MGYGAPGKGNTLLNYCAIRTDFFDYTVDRSPHKQGKFLAWHACSHFASRSHPRDQAGLSAYPSMEFEGRDYEAECLYSRMGRQIRRADSGGTGIHVTLDLVLHCVVPKAEPGRNAL